MAEKQAITQTAIEAVKVAIKAILFAHYWGWVCPNSSKYPQDCTIFFIKLNNVIIGRK